MAESRYDGWKSLCGVLIPKEHSFLLVTYSSEDPQLNGALNMPSVPRAGHETRRQAARRACSEQTGLVVEIIRPLANVPASHVALHSFLGKITGGNDKFEAGDGTGSGWYTADAINNLPEERFLDVDFVKRSIEAAWR